MCSECATARKKSKIINNYAKRREKKNMTVAQLRNQMPLWFVVQASLGLKPRKNILPEFVYIIYKNISPE